jgi:hypothetical protein
METINIPHPEKSWEDAMENEFNQLFGFGFFQKVNHPEQEISSSEFLEFARKWGRIAAQPNERTAPNNIKQD